MPVELERALKQSARKKFGSTTGMRARAYIYGTMQKRTAWRPRKAK